MHVMLCVFVMEIGPNVHYLNLHEMQTDKTLEISIHTNIDKNVTFSSTLTHCVILIVVYMFVKHVMHVM